MKSLFPSLRLLSFVCCAGAHIVFVHSRNKQVWLVAAPSLRKLAHAINILGINKFGL